jgi:DNA helicase IV
MNTLKRFQAGDLAIPASTAWYLSDLGEFRGKQDLCTRQSPQRLKVLREHAKEKDGDIIESYADGSERVRGLEFDEVVLLSPRDCRGLKARPDDLQRLQYVAMTRARKVVTLVRY